MYSTKPSIASLNSSNVPRNIHSALPALRSYYKENDRIDIKKKQLQNEKIKEKVKQYQNLRSQILFNSVNDSFLYNEHISPGGNMLHYMLETSNTNGPLSIFMPDTLVIKPGSSPSWYFNDLQGAIRCRTDFSSEEILNRFSPILKEEEADQYVVMKKMVLTPSTNNPKFLLSDGNRSTLVPLTSFLKTIEKSLRSRDITVFQRFISNRQAHVSFCRVVWNECLASKAWIISNVTPKNKTNIDIDKRYLCDLNADLSCNIYPIQGNTMSELTDVVVLINRFISSNIGRHFTEIVCDFIRDSNDRWWFLQVKSFSVRDGVPRLVGMEMVNDETSLFLMDTAAVYKKSRLEAEALVIQEASTGITESMDIDIEINRMLDQEHNRTSTKCFQCGCCYLFYPSKDLPYKMTINMINELKTNLLIRLGPSEFLTNKENHVSKKREVGSLRDTTFLYTRLSVCTLCYQVYKAEQKLIATSSALARAMGVPAPLLVLAPEKDGLSAPNHTTDPGNELITDILPEVNDVSKIPQNLPPQLCLVRILFILHNISDFPEDAFNQIISDDASICKKLMLRLFIFNSTFDLPIDSDLVKSIAFVQPEPKSPPNIQVRGGFRNRATSTMTNITAPMKKYTLPINYMKLFYILVNNTFKNQPLSSNSGLEEIIHGQFTPKVQIISLSDNKILSEGTYNMLQFRNGSICKIDQKLFLKVGTNPIPLFTTIGLDRVKDRGDFSHMRNHLIQLSKNVFLPPDTYFSSDAFPNEWIINIPFSGLSVLPKDISMGIWKNVEPSTKSTIEKNCSVLVSYNNDSDDEQNGKIPINVKPGDRAISDVKSVLANVYSVSRSHGRISMTPRSQNEPPQETPKQHDPESLTKIIISDHLSQNSGERETWDNSIWCINIDLGPAFNISELQVTNNQYPLPTVPDDPGVEILDERTPINMDNKFRNDTPIGKKVCVCRYVIFNIPFEQFGYFNGEEVVFERIYKHYIQGSLAQMKRFFQTNPKLELTIYNPSVSENHVYQCYVDWRNLMDSRSIHETFDILKDNQITVMPMKSFPPYMSTSIFVYRVGPLSREEILPFGYIACRKGEFVTLLERCINFI